MASSYPNRWQMETWLKPEHKQWDEEPNSELEGWTSRRSHKHTHTIGSVACFPWQKISFSCVASRCFPLVEVLGWWKSQASGFLVERAQGRQLQPARGQESVPWAEFGAAASLCDRNFVRSRFEAPKRSYLESDAWNLPLGLCEIEILFSEEKAIKSICQVELNRRSQPKKAKQENSRNRSFAYLIAPPQGWQGNLAQLSQQIFGLESSPFPHRQLEVGGAGLCSDHLQWEGSCRAKEDFPEWFRAAAWNGAGWKEGRGNQTKLRGAYAL